MIEGKGWRRVARPMPSIMSDRHDDAASRSTAKPPVGEDDAYGARTVTMKVDPALLIAAGASTAHLSAVIGGLVDAEPTPLASGVVSAVARDSDDVEVRVDVVELGDDDLELEDELAPDEVRTEPALDDPDAWDVE